MPMFERLQKPFLTVETGEAYQPIRLTYDLYQKEKLIEAFANLKCLERKSDTTWNWFWKDECDELHFESLDNYQKNPKRPLRIGTLALRNGVLYLNMASFKRACLAIPFFYRILKDVVKINKADFINKVFGLDERLPHGFVELFKEDELQKIVNQRISDFEKVQENIENAKSADEALQLLSAYTHAEAQKRLPYAERYGFEEIANQQDADIIFLSFYIFLRGRELVAIRRWFGETGYTLADAAEETVQKVFGEMDIDLLD